MFNFEDNIGLLVLKCSSKTKKKKKKKKTTPVCEGIFQIWQHGIVLWDKMSNFEDSTGLTQQKYSKIQVKKYNPNMDLELDPDLELTPPTWSKLRHRWD